MSRVVSVYPGQRASGVGGRWGCATKPHRPCMRRTTCMQRVCRRVRGACAAGVRTIAYIVVRSCAHAPRVRVSTDAMRASVQCVSCNACRATCKCNVFVVCSNARVRHTRCASMHIGGCGRVQQPVAVLCSMCRDVCVSSACAYRDAPNDVARCVGMQSSLRMRECTRPVANMTDCTSPGNPDTYAVRVRSPERSPTCKTTPTGVPTQGCAR